MKKLVTISTSVVFGIFAVTLGVLYSLVLFILRKRKVYSVWTGAPIINMAINASVERSLGVKALSIVRSTYFITSKFDIVLSDYITNKYFNFIAPYLAFLWIVLFAKRVHAYCDGGILPSYNKYSFNKIEIICYWIFRKDVVLWTYGADVRTNSLTRGMGDPNCCTECTKFQEACICSESKFQSNYKTLTRYSSVVFSMGDMSEYTPNSDNQLFFWPVNIYDDLKFQNPCYPKKSIGTLKIVHAPNHREFKGTIHLIRAVEALKDEGLDLDLCLVERVPNEDAILIYKSADIIFDQCMIGFHGYFALEAMALGKPVMCFIRKPEEYLLNPTECPIINTSKDTLVDDLRCLVTAKSALHEIGYRSRAYIEKHFTINAFGNRLKDAYSRHGIYL